MTVAVMSAGERRGRPAKQANAGAVATRRAGSSGRHAEQVLSDMQSDMRTDTQSDVQSDVQSDM